MNFTNFTGKVPVLLLLLHTLCLSHSIAQTTIEGVVIDNINNIPIVGANIEVTGTTDGTFSQAGGVFTLHINDELPAKIGVTFLGYELKEILITEPSNNLLVSMVPGALVGQEVVVSASRKKEKVQEAPSAMDVIESNNLVADGVMNPFLSLRNKAGIDISQTGVDGGHITLRGRSAVFQTETFVIADYRNLILPSLGTLAYGQQPVDPIDLEKIEIVKGAGSALYGPGVEAGIIHFISKSPFDLQGTTVSVGGGTRNAIHVSARHAGISADKRIGYKITGYYRSANDWEIDSTDAVEAQHLASFQPRIVSSLTGEEITDVIPNYKNQSYGLTGTLAFRPNDQTTLTATGGWSVGKAIFRTSQGEGYTEAPRPFAQLRAQSGGFFGQLFWSKHANSDGRTFLYPSGLTTITESHQLEGQLQYSFDIQDERIDAVMGIDYRLNTIDTKGTVHGRWEADDDYEIVGGYAQVEFKLGKNLDLVGAGRFDNFVALNANSFSPRLGLVYKPTPKHTIRATFNRAFGAPSAVNLFADLPLANQGAFLVHLLGGADEVTFDNAQTTSFLPGMGQTDGIGADLQQLYTLITGQLHEQEIIPKDIMEYLIDMQDQVQGISPGVLTQSPLSRGKLKLSSSNMYEIGYKGLFHDKVGLTVDFYYNQRRNIVSAPFQASPLVVQPTLGADLSAAIENNIDLDRLSEIGLSPGAIINLYSDIANSIAFDADSGSPNVLGLLRADQTPKNSPLPTLDLAYYNIREIDYFGLDVALKYYFSSEFSAYGSLSWLSQTYFEDVEVGSTEEGQVSTTDFSLNIPDTRLKFGIEYYPETGPNAFFMTRYQNSWNAINGLPWTGPVEAFVVADVGFGYTFTNDVKLNCTITNLFSEKYRAIYGAPVIGRQLIAKMQYHF